DATAEPMGRHEQRDVRAVVLGLGQSLEVRLAQQIHLAPLVDSLRSEKTRTVQRQEQSLERIADEAYAWKSEGSRIRNHITRHDSQTRRPDNTRVLATRP